MMTVYLLNALGIPNHEGLTSILTPHYTVRSVDDWTAIHQSGEEDASSQAQPTVVLFKAESIEEANLQSAKVKNILPIAACVAVIPETATGGLNPEQLSLANCDFLLPPYDTLNVLSRIAAGVRVSELAVNIEDSTHHDEVTLLYNRRYFFDRVTAEISLSKRHQSPLSCVVIGMNFYQVYLDCYGYEYILDLMRHIASVVRQQVRQEDVIARIADDEIGLLLPRSTEKGGKILTDRIINELTSIPFKRESHHDEEGEELVMFAGIAGYPSPGEDHVTADNLIRYAHHALHQARFSDTDKVQLFSGIYPKV